MSRHRRSLLCLLSLLAAASPPASAEHAWGEFHWPRSTSSFQLLLGDNIGAAWQPHVEAAVADWSTSRVVDLELVRGRVRPRTCGLTAGRVEVCGAAYGDTGWLGLAVVVAADGGHIVAAYVKLNETYWKKSGAGYTRRHRALVACQEIGHVLGLDHQDEDFWNPSLGTCMDYSAWPGPADQHPNAHDFEQLEAIYAHRDGEAAARAAAHATLDLTRGAVENLAVWGELVAISSDGRRTVFERHLGGGHRQITHVFWAFDVRTLLAE